MQNGGDRRSTGQTARIRTRLRWPKVQSCKNSTISGKTVRGAGGLNVCAAKTVLRRRRADRSCDERAHPGAFIGLINRMHGAAGAGCRGFAPYPRWIPLRRFVNHLRVEFEPGFCLSLEGLGSGEWYSPRIGALSSPLSRQSGPEVSDFGGLQTSFIGFGILWSLYGSVVGSTELSVPASFSCQGRRRAAPRWDPPQRVGSSHATLRWRKTDSNSWSRL
jgi:hypothetical protein